MSADPSPPPTSPWRARLLGGWWTFLLWLMKLTWRLRTEGLDRLDTALADHRPLIVAFWHGKYVPLFALLGGRQAVVFTSLSRRGDVIGEVCRNFGFRCAKLPDHGGERSRDIVRRFLRETPAGGLAADGPLGPYHVVKPGLLSLASELGMVVFPASVVCRPKKILTRRWDRMELPRAFARVGLSIGEPLAVPADLDPDGIGLWQQRLGEALDAAERRAARL